MTRPPDFDQINPNPRPKPGNGVNPGGYQLPIIEWQDECLADWADRDIPPQGWVMEDWIPMGQCTGLYGVAGILKTRLLIQLLLAKSKGLPFLGYQLEAGPVYGLFCEDRSGEIVRRATRIAKVAWGFDSLADFPNFHFASLVGVIDKELVTFDNGNMVPMPAVAHLDRKIVQFEAQLAALDTLSHFYGGNEIVRRDVTRFVSQLEAVGITRECGIVFTAHPSQRGRQSGSLESGSTGWEGSFRARITFHDPEEDANAEGGDRDRYTPRIPSDRRILTLFKANYAAPGATIETVVKDGAFFTTAVGPGAANRTPRSGPGRNDACDAKFLQLLAAVTAQGRYVSESAHSGHWAPKVFFASPDGKEFGAFEYKRAMERLFSTGRIEMGRHGYPPSKATPCIVDVQAPPAAADPAPAAADPAPAPAAPEAPPTETEIDAEIDRHNALPEKLREADLLPTAKRLRMRARVFEKLAGAAREAVAPAPAEPAEDAVASESPQGPSAPPGPTKAEIDTTVGAYLALDEGERALQRPAIAERLLGPKKLNVFDALVRAALKATAPTPDNAEQAAN